MTGPEHYKQAEQLLELVDSASPYDWQGQDGQARLSVVLAEAQAHATLALAAATAYPAVVDYHGDEGGDARQWARVTS